MFGLPLNKTRDICPSPAAYVAFLSIMEVTQQAEGNLQFISVSFLFVLKPSRMLSLAKKVLPVSSDGQPRAMAID